MRRQLAEQQGRKGEELAANYLRLKGWLILDQRVKTPVGEVDLVAKRGKLIAFVEVKWRANKADLDFAIDHHRLQRVAAAAETITHKYAREGEDVRIDVILLAPRSLPHHITNAWQP